MKTLIAFLAAVIFVPVISAQSGGDFNLDQIVAGGSGGTSAGGNFSVSSTLGQPFPGTPSNNFPFSMTIGFWTFTPLSPTAAPVTIKGRVVSLKGLGIFNARVSMTSQDGVVRTALTNPFGYFQIFGVPSGETYLMSVSAKGFSFNQSTRLINVLDAVSDADFVADN
jgi:hypothetical protein